DLGDPRWACRERRKDEELDARSARPDRKPRVDRVHLPLLGPGKPRPSDVGEPEQLQRPLGEVEDVREREDTRFAVRTGVEEEHVVAEQREAARDERRRERALADTARAGQKNR